MNRHRSNEHRLTSTSLRIFFVLATIKIPELMSDRSNPYQDLRYRSQPLVQHYFAINHRNFNLKHPETIDFQKAVIAPKKYFSDDILHYPIRKWFDSRFHERIEVSRAKSDPSRQSFQRFKNTRNDEMDEKIARRRFFQYGSGQSESSKVVADIENDYPTIRPLILDRDKKSSPKIGIDERRQNHKTLENRFSYLDLNSLTGEFKGPMNDGETFSCSKKILEMEEHSDFCDLVHQMTRLAGLLKRREFLLKLMEEDYHVEQSMSLKKFISNIIDEVVSNNTKLKKSIEDRVDYLSAKNAKINESEEPFNSAITKLIGGNDIKQIFIEFENS